jgi:hypothetical protein
MEPAYANLARISHSPADIVIDFAHILPGESSANIRSPRGDDPFKCEIASPRPD